MPTQARKRLEIQANDIGIFVITAQSLEQLSITLRLPRPTRAGQWVFKALVSKTGVKVGQGRGGELLGYHETTNTIGLSRHRGFFFLMAVIMEHATVTFPTRTGVGSNMLFAARTNRLSDSEDGRFK